MQLALTCITDKEPPVLKVSQLASFEISQPALKRFGQVQNGLEVVNQAITYIRYSCKFSNGEVELKYSLDSREEKSNAILFLARQLII